MPHSRLHETSHCKSQHAAIGHSLPYNAYPATTGQGMPQHGTIGTSWQLMLPPPAFSIGVAIIDAAATAEVIEGCHVTFCVS